MVMPRRMMKIIRLMIFFLKKMMEMWRCASRRSDVEEYDDEETLMHRWSTEHGGDDD